MRGYGYAKTQKQERLNLNFVKTKNTKYQTRFGEGLGMHVPVRTCHLSARFKRRILWVEDYT